jgi:hypothetical protein
LKGLSVALQVLLPVSAVLAVIGAVAAFHRASIVSDLSDNVFHSFSDIKDADDAVSGTATAFSFAFIATGVVFIIWQFRHAKNAERIAGRLSLSAGWAIGGWFIPAGNLVLPQLQLYRASAASDPDRGPGATPGSGRAPGVVLVWWVLFAVASALLSLGRIMRPSDNDIVTAGSLSDTADRFANADRMLAIGLLLMIPAAIAAVLMVRQLTERQAVALGRAPSPQPSYQSPYQQPYPPAYQQPYPGQQYPGQQYPAQNWPPQQPPAYPSPPTYPAPPPTYPAPPPASPPPPEQQQSWPPPPS